MFVRTGMGCGSRDALAFAAGPRARDTAAETRLVQGFAGYASSLTAAGSTMTSTVR
jgi:hypothetical protein